MSDVRYPDVVRLSVERHKLSDDSHVQEVMLRWPGGYVQISAVDKAHALRLFEEIKKATEVKVTSIGS